MNTNLYRTVQSFADLFIDLPDRELERGWKWKDHDEEGIRFALFVRACWKKMRQNILSGSKPSRLT